MEESVSRLTNQQEASQTNPRQLDYSTEYADRMLKRVVGFQIEITDLKGKWKLNQNHSEWRRGRVDDQLKVEGGEVNLQIAELIDADMTG